MLEDQATEGPVERVENQELKTVLAQHVAELNERERLVITLYYFERLTSKEIGSAKGLGQPSSS